MITLENHKLSVRFPEVHEHAQLLIDFQRTLRIPDDNRAYNLPPGLGRFLLAHVDDYAERCPKAWVEHGGVFLPMYQAEALWIHFQSTRGFPFAVKVAAGKINAVTGKEWDRDLHDEPQDYLSIPTQPWLDGFCVSKDHIRQFVAMPLGEGYTAEEQLTGKAEHGGLQLIVYPMKRERYLKLIADRPDRLMSMEYLACKVRASETEMGLAPGGLMKQQIYNDKHGLDAWDMSVSSRCYVHILNSLQYSEVTGKCPPTRMPTAKDYTKAGLPWFDYYDADAKALAGSKELANLDSVAAKGVKKGEQPLPDNEPVEPENVKVLGPTGDKVREGEF